MGRSDRSRRFDVVQHGRRRVPWVTAVVTAVAIAMPLAAAGASNGAGPAPAADARHRGGLPALPPQLHCVPWPTRGWPTGPLPRGVVRSAVDTAGNEMVGAGRADSVVVVHGGRLVYEKYAPGHDANTIEPSFSVSKSFTSTIIGMLVERGPLKLDARAPIPEWRSPADPRHVITLRNILNMSSGLQWNEDYSNGTSDVFRMIQAPDEAAYVIAKPLAFTPGSEWHYSTGDTEILGRIIADTARVRGAAYAAYLHRKLLDPLGISPVQVGFDPSGLWHSGWETNTTTRNFAKLGLLYLRGGVWEHRQFLSQKWVDFVRTPSAGSSGYGGQFWLEPDGSFEMIGLYGQLVHIVPQLDLVIAVNNGFGDFPMLDAFRNAQPASCAR